MPNFHGRNGIVYLQGAGATADLLSQAADWSIDVDFDLSNSNFMGDTWETANRGLSKFRGTFNGNFDGATTLPFDAAVATTARKFYVYPDRATPTAYYYGSCWPKVSIKGGTKANVGFSASWTGDGPLSTH
jgi:hypothetical protein